MDLSHACHRQAALPPCSTSRRVSPDCFAAWDEPVRSFDALLQAGVRGRGRQGGRRATYTGRVTVATAITHASSEPCSTPNTGSSAAAMMAYRLADAEPMAAGGTHAKACLYPKPHASANTKAWDGK